MWCAAYVNTNFLCVSHGLLLLFFHDLEGRLLDKVGAMHGRSGELDEADVKLQRAKECMERAGSIAGMASVLHHIGMVW